MHIYHVIFAFLLIVYKYTVFCPLIKNITIILSSNEYQNISGRHIVCNPTEIAKLLVNRRKENWIRGLR